MSCCHRIWNSGVIGLDLKRPVTNKTKIYKEHRWGFVKKNPQRKTLSVFSFFFFFHSGLLIFWKACILTNCFETCYTWSNPLRYRNKWYIIIFVWHLTSSELGLGLTKFTLLWHSRTVSDIILSLGFAVRRKAGNLDYPQEKVRCFLRLSPCFCSGIIFIWTSFKVTQFWEEKPT